MKWYYWLLILIAILLYEVLRKWGIALFKKLPPSVSKTIRKAVHWLITSLMEALRSLYEKLHLEKATPGHYATLTPTDNADPTGVYEQVLLENLAKPDVMNIALTGPYGSGKSSIIRTFIRHHPEYRYLNISLAAIIEAAEGDAAERDTLTGANDSRYRPGEQPNNQGKAETVADWTSQMSQQIEYSILQQMFYHVTDRKIPFSRFKRIRATSRLLLLMTTTGICLLALSVWFLFFDGATAPLPEKWQQWLESNKGYLQVTSWLVFAIGFFLIIYSLLRLYQQTQLIKLNLNSAQLEISPNKDASALNKHLDEIIYFFSVVPIDVVVIEDLDRFRNPEIFVKLREINTLINNSQAITRKITFLYALRDDVFVDEHRTKFFDFIAPVIPETNAANAASKLHQEIEKIQLPRPIPEAFLNDLGIFIQETRLLLNIANEFRIYQAQLKNFEINYAHLLAIIVYKNKYPTDFSGLQYNSGLVYAHFGKRAAYIEKILEKHKAKRKQLTEQLDTVKHNHLRRIEELRMIYAAMLFKEIFSRITIYGFNGQIVTNHGNRDMKDLTQEENFNLLRGGHHIHYRSLNGDQMTSQLTFSDIEKRVDEQSYDSRAKMLDQIFNQDRTLLERQLEQVNHTITEIRHFTMQQIMAQPEMKGIETPIDGHPLLVYLIGYGYLNETYSYYLSQFTEGEITKNDFDFIWAVKHRKELRWEHALEKLPALIKRLDPKEFSYPEMLNFDMAAYLVSTQQTNSEIRKRFMDQLQQLDNKVALFIDQYITKDKKVPEMVRALCAHATGLWEFIELQSNYTPEKKNLYLRLIIEHAEIQDIVRQNDKQLLSKYMSRQAFLLSPVEQKLDPVKLQQVCTALPVDFDLPEGDVQPAPEMTRFIYKHNRYLLNRRMLSLVLTGMLPNYDEVSFQPAQYTRILASDLDQLKAYIDGNFERYLTDIFLKIEGHTQESVATMLKVLNAEDITLATKKQVVSSTTFNLDDISACNDMQLWDPLLMHARMDATWANVHVYYSAPEGEDMQPTGLNKVLVGFLNMPACATDLSGQQITWDDSDHKIADMLMDICISGQLTDAVFPQYLEAMAFEMSEVDFGPIGSLQAQMLIGHNKVAFELSSLNSLKQHHPELAADWMLTNWEAFVALFSQLQLSRADWVNLLGKSASNAEQQKFLLQQLPAEQVIAVLERGVAIANETLAEKGVTADYVTLERISRDPSVSKDSVALIVGSSQASLDEAQVKKILVNMGGDFATLTDRQHPKVQKSDAMEKLLASLKDNQFFVASFETKNKYIHVTSHPAADKG